MEKPFNCWNCSACCRLCDKVEELKQFDKGDGTCIHLTEDNKCAIYETRPEICNTKRMYEKKWSNYFTWDNYLDFAEKACKVLEKEMKDKLSSS
jgi:Fe-S-cluster containining protein